jgi:hypothetical protein
MVNMLCIDSLGSEIKNAFKTIEVRSTKSKLSKTSKKVVTHNINLNNTTKAISPSGKRSMGIKAGSGHIGLQNLVLNRTADPDDESPENDRESAAEMSDEIKSKKSFSIKSGVSGTKVSRMIR